MLRALFVLLLGLFIGFLILVAPASAQIQYGGNAGKVTPPALNTLSGTADFERFMRNVTGTQLDVVDRTNGKIGGKTFPVDLSRGITKAGAIRAAAQGAKYLARATVPGIIIGAAAQAAWCKYDSGDWLCDPRQAQVEMDNWKCGGYPGPTPEQACTKYAETKTVVNNNGAFKSITTWTVRSCDIPTLTCRITVKSENFKDGQPNGTDSYDSQLGFQRDGKQLFCPPVINFYDPAYSVPGGPPDAQGKCPTGGAVATPPAEVETRLAPKIDTPAKFEGLVRESLGNGVDMTPHAQPSKVSGPATVTQTPTTVTTTSPTGQPSTTTTTVTNNITYEGDTFTWYDTTVTTYPDGSTETKTEEPPEEKSDCEKDPTALNCRETDVPAGPEVEKADKPVSFTPDAGWGAGNGTCPANKNLPFMGMSIELDLSLVCQFFTMLRAVLIGLAGLWSVFIILGGVRD